MTSEQTKNPDKEITQEELDEELRKFKEERELIPEKERILEIEQITSGLVLELRKMGGIITAIALAADVGELVDAPDGSGKKSLRIKNRKKSNIITL